MSIFLRDHENKINNNVAHSTIQILTIFRFIDTDLFII